MLYHSVDRKLTFMTIPKNASESIIRGLKKDFNIFSPKQQRSIESVNICILRDPYERWISGTVEEFLYSQSNRRCPITEMLKICESRLTRNFSILQDNHTFLQSSMYKWKKFNNIKFYYLTSSTLSIINEKYQCFDKIHFAHTSNFGKRLPYKEALIEWIYKKNYEHEIKDRLVKDYEFISKIKFET